MDPSTGPESPGLEPSEPRVGRASAFVGNRLLALGLLAWVFGVALLVFTGIQLWLMVSRGSFGSNVIPMAVGGILAFALLSIAGSAFRAGHGYLKGERAVARDLGRFVARRIERRRRSRGR